MSEVLWVPGALGSASKGYRWGTHRTHSPAETVAAVRPWMVEMGITRLADVTGLDCIGLPVFMAVRPNARGISVAQGKGVTRDAAMASALMEAVESWHCERVEVPLVYDSYASLSKRARTIDAAHLSGIRGAVFEPSSPLLWAEAAEVSRDDMFHYETAANLDDVHATAEFAQRPADKAFSGVDLSGESFQDDVTLLSAALARSGVDSVAVVDLTRSEIGIPVVKVVAAGLETDPDYPSYAAGERALAAAGSSK